LAAYFAGDGFPDEETQRALRAWAIGELTDESTAEYVDTLAALRGSEAAPEARAAFVARVLLHTLIVFRRDTKVLLTTSMPLFGGLPEPAHGLGMV